VGVGGRICFVRIRLCFDVTWYPLRAVADASERGERAVATGLIVGVSHRRFIDLFTIFAATLELQLHMLSRLGKRPPAAEPAD
jgi:hypothetical protein